MTSAGKADHKHKICMPRGRFLKLKPDVMGKEGMCLRQTTELLVNVAWFHFSPSLRYAVYRMYLYYVFFAVDKCVRWGEALGAPAVSPLWLRSLG